MAQPTPYDREANFSNYEALNPTATKPGADLDAEFNAIKVTSDQTLANLALIQRDDGALKNGIVTADSLADSLSIGFTLRGPWEAPQNYVVGDGVTYINAFWRCEASHLSDVADPPDDADVKWTKVVDFNDFAPAVISDGAVTTAKLADSVLSADATGRAKMADGYTTTAKLVDSVLSADTTGRAKMADKFVTLAKQADVATSVIMGRATAGTGVQEALSPAQVLTLLAAAGLGPGTAQCELVRTSSSLLTLNRKDGNRLFVNGVLETIPSTAPTLNVSGAVSGTLYYIYAFMSSGVMTLEYSATAPTADTTFGHQIKTGDATRTLVGQARPTTGPAWTNSSTQAFVRSYANRQPVTLRKSFTALRTTASGTFAEVNTEIRVEFLLWADEAIDLSVNGYAFMSGAIYGSISATVDGRVPGTGESAAVLGADGSGIGYSGCESGLAAGYHYATVMALAAGGAGTLTFDPASTNSYTSLYASIGR